MTGDRVTGVFYMTRSDGVKLFRFAVPNTKTGDEWDSPQFKIRQDQTGTLYDEAIDVENAPYTYTEMDIPAESDINPTPIDEEIVQKAEAFDYPTEQDNNIKNKILNIYTDIEEWKNPKDTGNSYNKSDKCYYKEQFWVSTIDNNISEPGGLANTWINI